MNKKIKEQLYDAYTVIVPAGVRLVAVKDVYAPDHEAYIISSYSNYGKIDISLQGSGLFINKNSEVEKGGE